MIFERSSNTSCTCNIVATLLVTTNKPQTLNSLNGKVFKRFEDNKLVGIGYKTVKPWEAA